MMETFVTLSASCSYSLLSATVTVSTFIVSAVSTMSLLSAGYLYCKLSATVSTLSLLSATVSMVSARLQQSNHYLSAEAATTLNLGITPSHRPSGVPTLLPGLSLNFVPCVCKFVCSHPNSGFWPLVYPPQLWCGSVRAATAISSRWCVALGRHMWSVRGQGPAQGIAAGNCVKTLNCSQTAAHPY